MSDRSPFRTLYYVLGLNPALKLAKNMGLEVTEEEINEFTRRDKAIEDSLNKLFKEMAGKEEE